MSHILCNLKNINLAFGQKKLFDQAEFSIHSGEKIGLLGLNGQGKSTLFKILCGEVIPDTSTPPFLFDKYKGDGSIEQRYSCFLIPQNPEGPLDQTIENYWKHYFPEIDKSMKELDKIESELMTNYTDKLIEQQSVVLDKLELLGAWDLENSIKSYLKYFGVENFSSPMNKLSGGEQKKVLLSIGLSSKDNLILIDEPTNHLDIEAIEILEDELASLNKTFVLISHDRQLLSKVCNKIFAIKNSRIEKFRGSYLDFLVNQAEQEEQRVKLVQKLSNTFKREQDWMRQGIKARGVRSKSRVDRFTDIKDKLKTIKGNAKKKLTISMDENAKKSKKIVQIDNLNHSYGERTLFNIEKLTVFKGNKIGILGENGSGKTTLLNIMAQRLQPTSGKATLTDDIRINFFDQNKLEIDHTISPFELLGEGTDFVDLPDGRNQHVISYFEKFLFNRDEVNRPISTFSGGEISRLQMAHNLRKAGDIWIFDEPTNDLDLETIEILEKTLQDFKGTVIIVSHDRAFLKNVTNQIWYLDNQTLESFAGGYEQAEEYIDTLRLENQIRKEEEEESLGSKKSQKVQEAAPEKKLSYEDNKLLKELPKKIEDLEKIIEDLQTRLKNLSNDDLTELTKISDDLSTKEEELLSLYEKLEELGSL